VRLSRLSTPDGPRQALIASDGTSASPPGALRLPGVSDPPLEASTPLDPARLLTPLRPSKIVAIGRNYAAHAAELGNAVPSRPMMFLKAPSSAIGPGAAVLLPPDSQRVEHEVELAVVIGRRCRHVAPEDWAGVVAGYTVLVDVTARDLQRSDKQFARGKGFDTFCPMGPWVETELDPLDLALSLRVLRGDGREELRQDGRTSSMIFDVPTLVAVASRVMTLLPGDVIATGTPEGVGPLLDGDVMVATIEGIGTLRNPVRDDRDVPDLPPPIAQAR
jgi:2-keto-4-pentenoate hydratase/2-oxohepta-3-ene-1,7-dioic acid hydratase in catechol pathway